jgi:AcrR family transcriptional regulator
MARASDKRERLVEAAKNLIHCKGFSQTTLADIAQDSGVPLGNVYYYFKTKEDIAAAVINERANEFHAMAEEWESHPDPRERLASYLEMPIHLREAVALHGCPFGSLAQELCKSEGPLADQARQLLDMHVEWVTEQYRLLDKEDAAGHALQFIATVQGISVLASTFNDPNIVDRQIAVLKRSLKYL